MAEKAPKGGESGGKKEEGKKEEGRKEEGRKEEELADTAELIEKRVHLTRLMKMINTKDEILALIEPS